MCFEATGNEKMGPAELNCECFMKPDHVWHAFELFHYIMSYGRNTAAQQPQNSVA